MAQENSLGMPIATELGAIHRSWGWFVTLGLVLVFLGGVRMVGAATLLLSVLALGWMLLTGAVLALVQVAHAQAWSGFYFCFLTALLRGFTGLALIRYPIAAEFGLTLLLASLLIVTGCFRAIGANAVRFPRWGWTTFLGLVSMALGAALLVQLTVASLWFIGLVIGMDFVFDGAAVVAFGMVLHIPPSLRRFAAIG